NSTPHHLALAIGIALMSLCAVSTAHADDAGHGVRFARADLVDVAMYVGEVTNKGFVLAAPELRTLSISMYAPGNPSPEQIEAMFLIALEAYGLQAIDQGDFWLIGPATQGEGTVMLDLRDATMTLATDVLTGVTGRNFVISDEANDYHVT